MREFFACAVASAMLAAGSATCLARELHRPPFYVPPLYAPVVPYRLPPATVEGRSVGVHAPPFVAPHGKYLVPRAEPEEPWDIEEVLGN